MYRIIFKKWLFCFLIEDMMIWNYMYVWNIEIVYDLRLNFRLIENYEGRIFIFYIYFWFLVIKLIIREG